jgi:hypothetical protein
MAKIGFATYEPGAVLNNAQRWSLPQILGEANDPLAEG